MTESQQSRSRVVVLGSCGAWPEPGRACSGLLLEHHGFRVAVDLGYGTLPLLLQALGSPSGEGLDAVVVTHRHPDHMVDLHGLFRARSFGNAPGGPLPLLAAEGVLENVKALEEDDGSAVDEAFRWVQLPRVAYDLGPFTLESRLLPHSVPSVGVRLSAPGLVVACTGDTGYVDELHDLGRDADLFVVEATDEHQQGPSGSQSSSNHLTAHEAGAAASAADARAVLLTHFWPGNDREASRRTAAEVYRGPVLVAEEGMVVDLPVTRRRTGWDQ